MTDESQILVPDSFAALYRDRRGRLTQPLAELRARSEWCEDLAQMLVEPSRARSLGIGLDDDTVLDRTLAGLLAADPPTLNADEARWVVTRLAELLGWQWADALPVSGPGPRPLA